MFHPRDTIVGVHYLELIIARVQGGCRRLRFRGCRRLVLRDGTLRQGPPEAARGRPAGADSRVQD